MVSTIPQYLGRFVLTEGRDDVQLTNETFGFSKKKQQKFPTEPYGKEYIRLESISHGMTKPCLIDFKL